MLDGLLTEQILKIHCGISELECDAEFYVQYLEEASFLYTQRLSLVDDPDVIWQEMDGFIHDRLYVFVDALCQGDTLALSVCKRQAIEGDAGELFAAVGVFGAECLPLFGWL